MKIRNIDIFESANTLYIKCSDGKLINISGDDIEKVKIVINHLMAGNSMKKLKSLVLFPDEVDEIVSYLYQNDILIDTEKKREKKRDLVGFYGDNVLFKLLKDKLNLISFKRVTTLDDLDEITFLIVATPLFEHFIQLQEISTKAYKNNINVLYSEITSMSFTVGPLSIPDMQTPSLGCYMQRKLTNVKAPHLYTQFIYSKDKKTIKSSSIQDYPYFRVGLELLIEEINRYLKYDGTVSQHLIAKSLTINFFNYECEESRVLKDPFSPVFTSTPFVPFNG
jgi:hypothetical protein